MRWRARIGVILCVVAAIGGDAVFVSLTADAAAACMYSAPGELPELVTDDGVRVSYLPPQIHCETIAVVPDAAFGPRRFTVVPGTLQCALVGVNVLAVVAVVGWAGRRQVGRRRTSGAAEQ